MLALGLALSSATAAAGDAAVVDTASDSEHGPHLVDGDGMSLYLFEADERGPSTCYEKCADAWPPLLTQDRAVAEGKLDPALLGAIKREDGSRQVTYNGWPLYYFVKDEAPGDTSGQDVEGFGAEWYLVTPSGGNVGH